MTVEGVKKTEDRGEQDLRDNDKALASYVPFDRCVVLDGEDAFDLRLPCHRRLARARLGEKVIDYCSVRATSTQGLYLVSD